jgi:hypothetical protein
MTDHRATGIIDAGGNYYQLLPVILAGGHLKPGFVRYWTSTFAAVVLGMIAWLDRAWAGKRGGPLKFQNNHRRNRGECSAGLQRENDHR